MTTSLKTERVGLGIAMMLATWFMFSLVDTSVKWLVVLGIPAFQLAFIRYFVSFLLSLVMSARAGPLFGKSTRQQIWLLNLRAALLLSATVLNFIALNYLSLTITSSIMFSSPIIVSALSGPLLGERVGPWRWFAIAVGFVGVLIVIRPFGESFHWASLMILYNAFALAVFSIITRKLAGEVSPQTMQIYMGAMGTFILLPLAIWTWTNPENYRDWAIFLCLGAFAWAGHDLFSRAHRFAAANVLMPFSYSFIIYLSVLSYFIFGDVPDEMTLLGVFVIILSGLIIWWRENRTKEHHGPA